AVTVAGILSGLGFLGKNLRDQRMLLVGAGAAGIGVGDLISAALKAEGLNDTEIRQRKLFLDSGGIVHVGRGEMDAHKCAIAWLPEDFAAAGMGGTIPTGLEAVVQSFRPTILVGMTGTPGEFTPGVIRAMATHCDRPLIFPLSNPTSKAECTPSEALQHSDGRALVATGSPFEPVLYQERRHVIGQCNNAFIFPGVGLGALVAGASQITNSMFLAAARTLAEYTVSHISGAPVLFPTLAHLRDISRAIGFKVAQTARDEGVGRKLTDAALQTALDKFIWYPDYPEVTR
ncbi:MAG TPA: malic enzyme-like NAD(P)-binding protein, partial [Dongiaceae bacterium]|nr:malic enzyme-like NAD(P)-binding protein [Dongiaceae bacterium]